LLAAAAAGALLAVSLVSLAGAGAGADADAAALTGLPPVFLTSALSFLLRSSAVFWASSIRSCAAARARWTAALDLGLVARGHGLGRLRLLGTLLLLALARNRDLADIRHARCKIAAIVNQDPRATVAEDHLDLVVGEQLGHEADVEHRVMDDVAFLVGVADRVRSAVVEVGVGRTRHRVLPRHPPLRRLLGGAVGGFLDPITARLSVRVDLAAHHALHAADFVLVHTDDRVGRVRLAAGGRAVRLDLSAHFIGVFFEDGIHPMPLLDEWSPPTSLTT